MIKPIIATLLLAFAAGTLALADDSIDAIIASPATFDGKHVDVTGTIANYKEKTSKAGNDYTLFDLCQTKCVGIYEHGHPTGLKDGGTTTIHGTFAAVRHMRGFDITNQIDADDSDS